MDLNQRYLALALVTVLCGFAAGCDLRDFVPIPSVRVAQPTSGSMVTNPVYFELEAKNWTIESPNGQRDGAGYFVLALEGVRRERFLSHFTKRAVERVTALLCDCDPLGAAPPGSRAGQLHPIGAAG